MITENQPIHGSFAGVVVSKKDLLDALQLNKEKHDNLYAVSLEKYRLDVEDYAKKKEEYYRKYGQQFIEFAPKVAEDLSKWDQKSQFAVSPLVDKVPTVNPPAFPQSHEDDYLNAIRRVQMSVYDSFSLSESEFQQFILNKWSWRASFVSSIDGYTLVAGSGLSLTGAYYGYTLGQALSEF